MLIQLEETRIWVSFLASVDAPLRRSRQQTVHASSYLLVVLVLDTWQLSPVFLFQKPMDSTVVQLHACMSKGDGVLPSNNFGQKSSGVQEKLSSKCCHGQMEGNGGVLQ
jgi:hypothetical protein